MSCPTSTIDSIHCAPRCSSTSRRFLILYAIKRFSYPKYSARMLFLIYSSLQLVFVVEGNQTTRLRTSCLLCILHNFRAQGAISISFARAWQTLSSHTHPSGLQCAKHPFWHRSWSKALQRIEWNCMHAGGPHIVQNNRWNVHVIVTYTKS